MQQSIFEETHQNHFLFSDHYLNEILPRLPTWEAMDELEKSFSTIKSIYLKLRDTLAQTNEAQLENDFIRPILKALGHHFEVQTSVHLGKEVYTPDYTFFSTREDQLDARKHKGQKEFYQKALAVGDAKHWGRPLDRKIRGKSTFDNQNPSYQIDTYLKATGLKWGILTNGKEWRLYNRDTSFSMDSFYSVDITKLIEQDDLNSFKYFYLFFRRQGFETFDTKPSFLDFIYSESTIYTVGVQKDLKQRVYEALGVMANGLLKFPNNQLDSVKDLENIHDNCLILLYRMLFVFYAEARGLLPDDDEFKQSFGFDTLKKEIKDLKDKGTSISPVRTDYWNRLKSLFMLIDNPFDSQGNCLYNMPQYNGGLFDTEKHPFLEQVTIGDKHMAEAFNLLARTRTKDGLAFVDYRDLDVKHLGSIYEGLLEYKLKYAEQDKVVIKTGKKKQEKVENKVDNPELPVTYQKGEYYLVTDKGERKATGSYYTPDYIVRYIVENTLRPVVERCKTYKEILELNILDPAMGSGHFLVGVVDYLAEQIATHPTCGVVETGEDEKEIAHWRRWVVERCAYGVDLNPLAVELAKLSLWLHTVSYGKPLSFLDHHLHCGNSLIGARIEDLAVFPDVRRKKKAKEKYAGRQLKTIEPLFHQKVSKVVGHYLLIEKMETQSKRDIEEKEKLLKIAGGHIQQFKELANVWVSAYFDSEVNGGDYQELVEALEKGSFSKMYERGFFGRAQDLAAEKRFFHWEMEFADVFFDKYGRWLDNPGFDGVVGNPPYVNASMQKEFDSFLRDIAAEVHTGYNDIMYYFYHKGLSVLRLHGLLGLITSHYFIQNYYGTKLRNYLQTNSEIQQFINLEDNEVFENVGIHTCLLILRKAYPSVSDHILSWTSITKVDDLETIFREGLDFTKMRQERLEPEKWIFISADDSVILDKAIKISKPLSEFCIVDKGSTTGLNDVFIVPISFAAKRNFEPEIARPCLKNSDIRRYRRCIPRNILLYIGDETDIEKFPNVLRYLKENKERLSKRNEVKKGLYPYYRLERPRNKENLSAPEKIVVPYRSERNNFAYDDKQLFLGGGDMHLICMKKHCPINIKYILAVLNSKLGNFLFRFYGKPKGRMYEYFVEPLSSIPIRDIPFGISITRKVEIVHNLKRLYQEESFPTVLTTITESPSPVSDTFKPQIFHDVLVFLCEKMIGMHEELDNEIRKLTDWTKLKHDLDLSWLSDKIWQNYNGFDFDVEEFFHHLGKGRVHLTPNQTAEIKAQFEQSVSVLKPLITRIEKTDWLIDQIVYRLYGLTEEEIRVVEESVG